MTACFGLKLNFENYQKRVERDKTEFVRFVSQDLISELLSLQSGTRRFQGSIDCALVAQQQPCGCASGTCVLNPPCAGNPGNPGVVDIIGHTVTSQPRHSRRVL